MYTLDQNSPIPLYHQVFTSVVERIQSGEFPVDSLIPSYRQLAEDYNVSTISILRALEILQQKGFVEKKRGRGNGTRVVSTTGLHEGEATSRRKNIVLCSGFSSHPYILSMIEGVTSIASKEGYTFQFTGLTNSEDDEREKILDMIDGGCDGLIVYPFSSNENISLFASLAGQNFPLVFIDRYFPEVETDCVLNEDEEGGFLLTRALIQQGHRRIALVHMQRNEGQTTSVNDRIKGYQRALAENGLPFDESLVWLDIYQQAYANETQATARAACVLLGQRIEEYRPTAFLAINQDTAQRVAFDLNTLKVEPGQVSPAAPDSIRAVNSLATFSFTDEISLEPFDISLAVQSGRRMGCEAAQLLIERIAHPGLVEKKTIRVPVTIVATRGGEPTG